MRAMTVRARGELIIMLDRVFAVQVVMARQRSATALCDRTFIGEVATAELEHQERRVLIMVTGPVGRFSGVSAMELQQRLNALAAASLGVLKTGHVPVVGVFQAYPMIDLLPTQEEKLAVLEQCYLALMDECEALLVIGHSPGVQMKIDIFKKANKPIYTSVDALPDLHETAS
jgi:hypothetical protein